jgi:hypothetical protein
MTCLFNSRFFEFFPDAGDLYFRMPGSAVLLHDRFLIVQNTAAMGTGNDTLVLFDVHEHLGGDAHVAA